MAYTFDVNVQGTGRLMVHCAKVKTFVHCSTGGVYAHATGRSQGVRPLRHAHPGLQPLEGARPSSWSVSCAEQSAVPTVILRIGAVYGYDATGPAVRLDRMVRGKEVWVNPTEPRGASVMWQGDAVRLAIKAFDVGQVPPLTVNFCGDEAVSIEEYCTL